MCPSLSFFNISQTRTEILRPINQRENKVQTFFWHIPHFIYADQRRYLTISLRNGAAPQPRELNQAGPTTNLQATPYGPVILHSYTYATLLRDRGKRQSGSNVEVPNTVPWHAEHGISVLEMSLL